MYKDNFACRFYHILFLVSLATSALGQSDFIIKDSAYMEGKVFLLKEERLKFQKSKKDTPVIYELSEIKASAWSNRTCSILTPYKQQIICFWG